LYQFVFDVEMPGLGPRNLLATLRCNDELYREAQSMLVKVPKGHLHLNPRNFRTFQQASPEIVQAVKYLMVFLPRRSWEHTTALAKLNNTYYDFWKHPKCKFWDATSLEFLILYSGREPGGFKGAEFVQLVRRCIRNMTKLKGVLIPQPPNLRRRIGAREPDLKIILDRCMGKVEQSGSLFRGKWYWFWWLAPLPMTW